MEAIELLRTVTWRQLGAAIDQLGDAIAACPAELGHARLGPEPAPDEEFAAAWYLAFHAIFWLDLHLHGDVATFEPPPPYTRGELEAGVLPPERYSREQLRAYLGDVRQRAAERLAGLALEGAAQPFGLARMNVPYAEELLYTMRHVQEHAAQLALFISQQGGAAPGWVPAAR
jgi:hypothetical protein